VADVSINLVNGETAANGPGGMTTVRRGTPDLATAPVGENPTSGRPASTESDENRLTCLSVRFQGSLAGNLHHRETTFHDQVQAVYGPVDSWQSTLDPDDPDGLGPRGVLLNCDQLKVAEMPSPAGNDRAVELEALGNVVVEGRTFTARAPRMTYTHAKQLLILEGDGRTDAELYHQEQVGATFRKLVAHKILYWRSTGQARGEGVRSLTSN